MNRVKFMKILVVILCLTMTLSITTYAEVENYDSSYFRHIEQYSEGYVEYMFATNQSPYNDSYNNRSVYCTCYETSDYRVGVVCDGSRYSIVSQRGSIIAYDKTVYSKSDGSVGGIYDGLGSSYNSVNMPYGSTVQVLYTNMYIFPSYQELEEYLQTGDIEGAIATPSIQYNAEELQLSNVNIQVFDSNSFEHTYIEYYYQCDESLIGATIEFDYTYTYGCSTVTNSNGYGKVGEEHISYSITDTKGTIRVYIKDLQCINDVLSGVWFNDEPISKRNVMGYGGNFYIDSLLYKVDTSKLDIIANVTNGNVYGKQYIFNVDLKTGKANQYTNTPSEDGEYNYNNDYTENGGNYITVVDTDDWGNTTYNYYYYDYSDNSKTEITNYPTEDDDNDDGNDDGNDNINSDTTTNIDGSNITNTNTNNNNPTFENNVNVTVEGDEINNDIDNVIDGVINNDDNKSFVDEFLKLFGLLENNSFIKVYGAMFGWLPSQFQTLITSAIVICAGIGVYKLFKR